eukprot:CAMPEP_0176374026 /NCGR_PEP_ID=MMETSP0126-20121128/26456_1 /TAXON_ID=141414 ORGANISM="Strombidinopsis acuminatum, Strain SPMC142" /NCGR_SAMPLE_ID=MMETSP0126 /ASSEMBLY_ACC=CAM_ASM_000229 /LENGTH=57 /DNA_ID=CAMNT_0017734411 /DNA_START=381 /DNA_END=554 /DNA_ORIENTATION=+
MTKEAKDMKALIHKRENEMKEVVRTLKTFSEDKKRLEKENESLRIDYDQFVGHNNPS